MWLLLTIIILLCVCERDIVSECVRVREIYVCVYIYMLIFSLSQVRKAKPVVDTKGIETPAHIQKNLKKVQVSDSFICKQ